MVLDEFQKHNITVNIEKRQFFKQKVKFLGYIISAKGIKIDKEKIDTIRKFKSPAKKKDIQRY